MESIPGLVILYAVGVALLIAEIFIPSHGVLMLAAVGFLGIAVYETFRMSTTAGYGAVLLLAILLPTFAIVAVKVWHRTPLGQKIAIPNPILTTEDAGAQQHALEPYVGRIGTSLTPLRPVGECRFGDDKVECVAESGMIERGVPVEAVGIVNMSLAVRPCADDRQVT
jgi:membrane-bound serine protease (ClpP class)